MTGLGSLLVVALLVVAAPLPHWARNAGWLHAWAGERPCDFLPIGAEGATLDVQGPDTHAQCSADLLVGERSATSDRFVGVFSVSIVNDQWGDVVGLYGQVSQGGTPIDLGDEGVFRVLPSAAAGGSGTDVYGAYFLDGPYFVSVEHTVMDPDFFVEDTTLTRTLTEALARAIDAKMDAAGVGAPVGSATSPPPVAPPAGAGDGLPTGGSADGGGVPIGIIAGVVVIGIGGAAVTVNVLRRRPARPGSPDLTDAPRCWDEVAAIDDAAGRLERERDDLRRARDDARRRIEAIRRALEAERTLDQAFQGYADAVLRTQRVHVARVYADTAMVVSGIFAAGAAGIEMLNGLLGIEAATMTPQAAAVAGQLEQGVQATRAAAQAAARLPELQSKLAHLKRLFDASRTAELATATGQQIAATEQAIAAAHSTIGAGAAAAEAAPGLTVQLSQLTGLSLPAQIWARTKGVAMMAMELAGNAAVDSSKRAQKALGRLATAEQERLFEEVTRAMDAQRSLAETARDLVPQLRTDLARLQTDISTAERLLGEAEAKIADVAQRRADKVAECTQLAALAAAP